MCSSWVDVEVVVPGTGADWIPTKIPAEETRRRKKMERKHKFQNDDIPDDWGPVERMMTLSCGGGCNRQQNLGRLSLLVGNHGKGAYSWGCQTWYDTKSSSAP